jgi:hypothetical protein
MMHLLDGLRLVAVVSRQCMNVVLGFGYTRFWKSTVGKKNEMLRHLGTTTKRKRLQHNTALHTPTLLSHKTKLPSWYSSQKSDFTQHKLLTLRLIQDSLLLAVTLQQGCCQATIQQIQVDEDNVEVKTVQGRDD